MAGLLRLWREGGDAVANTTESFTSTSMSASGRRSPGPGSAFYANPPARQGRMRLNFSHSTPEQIDRGLRVLAETVRETSVPAGRRRIADQV